MSLQLIQESAKEVRRLAIAGSPLAVGDFRLKKLIAPLEQAGAKAPVFGQVAKAISEVVNGKESESAANLLTLSTLLNAILYTQGQGGTAAPFEELATFSPRSGEASTRTSARVLKPIITALTTTGSGRFETVKTAIEQGVFNDLRLVEPAVRALDDIYPELADLVAEKILPSYGPGIVPLLRQGFNLKGKKGDARRLAVLHRLDPDGAVELCKTALDDGSVEVKEAAITCLGKHEECLPLVLEQANAKSKVLRAAALEALAEHDRPETTKLFTELVAGKALDLLARAFRTIRNPQVMEALLKEGRRVFDLLRGGDESMIVRFSEILECLSHRKDAGSEEFLLGCFVHSDKVARVKGPKNSVFTGADVLLRLAGALYQCGSPRALEALLAKRDTLPSAAFYLILRSARRTWTPARVFDEFSPLLAQKKGAGRERADQLLRTIWVTREGIDAGYYYGIGDIPDDAEAAELAKASWDPRWLDAVIAVESLECVSALARPGHAGVVQYLLKLANAKNPSESGQIIEALTRCQYPKVTDVFLDLVARKTKSARQVDYEVQYLFRSAQHLPPADLPRLDAFAAGLDEKFVDSFLEALGPLRTPGQA